MKALKGLAAAGLLSLALVIPLAQAPAGAAAGCVDVHKAGDPSWATVCQRQKIAVCDADNDGHKVYVHFWPQWSLDYSTTGYDSYGYTNGQYCHHETPSVNAFGIDRFQVCIQTEGCSVWKNAG